MINTPKLIIGLIVTIIAVFFYLRTLRKNENKRSKEYRGYICPRCRQGFEENELYAIWQFPTTPLRIMGWNKNEAFDLNYCYRCKHILNAYMILSLIISIPIVLIFTYMLLLYLGIINE